MDAEKPPGFAGRHSLAPFQDLTEPDQFALGPAPHRLRLGTPLSSAPAAPLFRRNQLPARVAQAHDSRMLAPGAELYYVPDHQLGADGLLQRQGSVFSHPSIMPSHYIKPDTMPAHWVRGLFRPDAAFIDLDTPAGAALNPHFVWGHFLLEMFVRLHLLAQWRSLAGAARICVPAGPPPWIHEFVGLYFTAAETILYDADTQRVRAPGFILPNTMSKERHHLHPMVNAAVAELLARVVNPSNPAPGGGAMLYLSRSRHQGWHRLTNEAEVELAMQDLGFTVFHPQEHGIAAQLAIYSNARCMVAPFSSAAHNALFAPIGVPVFCFGWMNRCQSAIAALRAQPIGYMAPADRELIYPEGARDAGGLAYSIDCRRLAQELPAFLRFAAEHRLSR